MLRNVLPLNELKDKVGSAILVEEYGPSQMSKIINRKGEVVLSIAGNVWDRILGKGLLPVANPRQFGHYFDSGNPGLYKAMSTQLGIEVIRDIYFVKAYRDKIKSRNLVAELLLAHVYPNDLHLGDVTFMNPEQPIPEAEREFYHREYQGFGLLPSLIRNLRECAVDFGHENITLTAASTDQVSLFARYGFVVSSTPMGPIGMATGHSIPMEYAVSRSTASG